MLSRAVQGHHPGPPGLKGTTLSQHYRANAESSALKPLPAAALNTTILSWPQSNNPLKRTSSQTNDGDSLKSSQEQARKKTFVDMAPPAAGGGRVGKLHETVFFDEDDFEDDENINLDEESSPNTHEGIHSGQSSVTLLPDASVHIPPNSSGPLPWSSSPPSHQKPLAPIKAAAKASPSAKNTKRRTIPWLEGKLGDEGSMENDTHCEQPRGEHSHAEPRDKRRRKANEGVKGPKRTEVVEDQTRPGQDKREPKIPDFTPAKHKPSSKFPWNTTASAVKEQQKQLRQGHRKLVKDNDGDEISKSNAKKKRGTVAKVFLSEEQKSVLHLVAEKQKSVFFTGSAGTGKSVLLREIIKALRDKHKREPDRVAVTASTGLAACNVGGVTLHSFAGIGLGKETAPELVKKIKKNQKAKTRWMRTKVLIVDEISMVDGDLFDKLESIARAVRNNGRPFGGIQLIITGDFFQLPPVPDYGRVSKFSFDAATWNTSIEHTIGLNQVFRQKDPEFANMLNEMRVGKLSPNSIHAFQALNRPLSFADDFEATELFPTRNEVDNANNARMKNLAGKEVEFRAEDGGSIQDHNLRNKLLANCMAPATISLKKGAQVMLIKNIDESLVNGSVGKVIAFMDEKTFDIYHDDEDEFQAVETMGLDDVGMNESRKKLKALIHKDLAGDTSQKWPLVRFSISDGTTRDLLCQRESWKIELPDGEVQASRAQVPLILAWALSIHKAQGQTLDRVKVDLGKIFEKGQAYVALSRATCQEGLHITRFDPKKVMAHDRVRTFYDSLYSMS